MRSLRFTQMGSHYPLEDLLRHGGTRGELAGVAGVHAAEEGLHQPVDDLLAEAVLDQPADRDVLPGQLGRGQADLQRGPDLARTRQDVLEGSHITRNAHQGARHRH